jgi:hypothetical protein
MHAGGVVGKGDTEVVIIETVNGFILVLAEIDGSPFRIGGAEGIEGDTAAGNPEPEGVGAVTAGTGVSGVFGRLLGRGGEGSQDSNQEE